MDCSTTPTVHWASLRQMPSLASPSDQQALAPLRKGDFAIVAFV